MHVASRAKNLRLTFILPSSQFSSIASLQQSINELRLSTRPAEHHHLISLLRQCCKLKALNEARALHLHISKAGYAHDSVLGSLLLQIYGSFGLLHDAEALFRNLNLRSVFTWNMMLSAYAHSGHMHKAQIFFNNMHERNVFTWNIMINAFNLIGDFHSASFFFEKICHWTVISFNVMLTAFTQMGDSSGLVRLFNRIPEKNVVSWNTVLYCHLELGQFSNAREIFSRLPGWDVVTCSTLLAAFAKQGDVQTSKTIFDSIPEPNVVSWNALIQAHAVSGDFGQAKRLFDEMPSRTIVSWNGMLQVMVEQNRLSQAQEFFNRIPEQNVISWNTHLQACAQCSGIGLEEVNVLFDRIPVKDVVSHTVMIAACSRAGNPEMSKEFFDRIDRRNLICWNCLLQVLVENGVNDCKHIFDLMPYHDSFSWNTMITFLGQQGDPKAIENLFVSMPQRSLISWNSVSFAFAQQGNMSLAKKIFDLTPKLSISSWNGLMTGYIVNFDLDRAREVFASAPEKPQFMWTALTLAYAQNGYARESLNLFAAMDLEGMEPEPDVFSTFLDSCAVLSALQPGKIIEEHLRVNQVLDVALESSIVNLYGKCGCLDLAKSTFDAMNIRNLVSWNTMIAVYAQNGEMEMCLDVFESMKLEGIHPDSVTFLTVLNACSHAGLVCDAVDCFVSSKADFGVEQTAWMFGSLIDLLGRAGELENAEELITSSGAAADGATWQAFLSSCRSHGDTLRGARAASSVARLDPLGSAPYILMSHITFEQGL